MIIGCGGSGKTTLALQLGEKLSLPVFHLDQLFWKPGWQRTPTDEWHALQNELFAPDKDWIMDGYSSDTLLTRLSVADTIIFLDLPTLTCLTGAIRRYLKYRGQNRPDMGEGCFEKLDWGYLRWITTYRIRQRPKILSYLELHPEKRVITLRSRSAVKRFLQGPFVES